MNWISVEERLPVIDVDVLTFDSRNADYPMLVAQYNGLHFYETIEGRRVFASHWMELPEAPK